MVTKIVEIVGGSTEVKGVEEAIRLLELHKFDFNCLNNRERFFCQPFLEKTKLEWLEEDFTY